MSNPIERISVDIAVELGAAIMPVHQLLRMGRGAVIELDTLPNEHVKVLANGMQIAEGEVVVSGEAIAVSVTKLGKPEV
ncbi:MAG: FliM/FliN family flagellar motor switch protein [Devosiaceae bacterium]|nr:FliM/FliN family flagellar motor switch protein [Devosiaceae bacterium MH13]